MSIPKPKLEPFFKNNSNPDLRSLRSNNLNSLKTRNGEEEEEHYDAATAHVSFNSTPPMNKKQLTKNRSSSLTSAYNTTGQKYSEPNVGVHLSTTKKKVKFGYNCIGHISRKKKSPFIRIPFVEAIRITENQPNILRVNTVVPNFFQNKILFNF